MAGRYPRRAPAYPAGADDASPGEHRCYGFGDAGPSPRRDLRALPGPLRTAAARRRARQAVGATLGVVECVLSLFRDDGVTHLGCAADHVIRSWRNARSRVQDRGGHATRAAGPVPPRGGCTPRSAWSSGRWSSTRRTTPWAPRREWADDPEVERVVIMSPDKDMAQCVREDGRVVVRPSQAACHRCGRCARQVRRLAGSIPDYLALVGDSADGYPAPGLGRKSAGGADALPASRGHPRARLPGTSRSAEQPTLAAALREHRDEAFLFRELATLRTDAPIPRVTRRSRWRGVPRVAVRGSHRADRSRPPPSPRAALGRLTGSRPTVPSA